jgi:hypothetical protein
MNKPKNPMAQRQWVRWVAERLGVNENRAHQLMAASEADMASEGINAAYDEIAQLTVDRGMR